MGWRRRVFVLFPVAGENLIFAGTFNYSAFPLSIFEMCFNGHKTGWSEIIHSLTDGRRDSQKHLKDTWGKKTSSLISATRRRVQAVHVGCLLCWSQSWGDLGHWSSTELAAVTWDLHWRESGPTCLKLALISCLSSKNRTILWFLQRTWKWKILHSLVAYGRASQLWWAALGASVLGCQTWGT